MSVRAPSLEEFLEISRCYGLRLGESDFARFSALITGTLASYERLGELSEPKLSVQYPRTPGQRPSVDDNPLNAWYWTCSIKGAPSGPLAGKKVAIKDNVAVAGIPMMNGCSLLEGFVPDGDATVVTRILDAGGEITGKAVCEHLCFSGGSHITDYGPVLNPRDRKRNAGGSSSGSAALVANGDCHMAIGGDQGGSIRVPSSYCGIYGLKPTYGLVPYTGAAPIERTLDHLGPMAATVHDVALLLEAIAGPDGLDPRQDAAPQTSRYDYRSHIDDGVLGLRIGIVEEGFGWPQSEVAVDAHVRSAAEALGKLGASIHPLSIPLHRDGLHIWTGIALEGAFSTVVRGNSGGTNAGGYFDVPLIDVFSRARSRDASNLSVTVKLTTILGEYLQQAYGGRFYGKARNISRLLCTAYDSALGEVDLLLMPTTPRQATVLPEIDASIDEIVARAWECEVNTRPIDVSGHPAMNVPCAQVNGLPVGMMIVGRRFEERTVLRAARALESKIFAYPARSEG